jgi:hypothetical protein
MASDKEGVKKKEDPEISRVCTDLEIVIKEGAHMGAWISRAGTPGATINPRSKKPNSLHMAKRAQDFEPLRNQWPTA